MFTIKQRKCFNLSSFVYITVIIKMVLYLVVSVGGVVMFVMAETPGRLAVLALGSLLVISLLGLVTSLLLVMGLVTSQAKLFLPWILYHSSLSCLCVLGGLYQCGHFLMTDPLLSSLAILPIVLAIFLLFFCLFVCQLYRQMRSRPGVTVEKAPAVTVEAGGGRGYRCVRSVRSLKRRSELKRSRSVDTVHSQYRRDTDRQLERVRSDPHLSIPRASLTRTSEKKQSNTSLSSSAVRPAAMTREQIIDMFSCQDSQGY